MRWLWLLLIPAIGFSDQVRVQVLVEQDTEVGVFRDALYYPLATFPGENSKTVQDDRISRVNNYVKSIKDASAQVTPEPTKEDLQKQSADKQAEIDRLILEKADLDAVISTK